MFVDVSKLTDKEAAGLGNYNMTRQDLDATLRNITEPERFLTDDEEIIGLPSSSDGSPGRIRYGDMNIDGFDDLLITLTIRNRKTGKQRQLSMVLENQRCEEDSICAPRPDYEQLKALETER